MSGVCPLLLLLLLSASVCKCVSPDLPRDFGVKLCGREFIRAVIFTCGGSRWRRENSPAEGAEWLDQALSSEDGTPLTQVSSLVPLMDTLGSRSQMRMRRVSPQEPQFQVEDLEPHVAPVDPEWRRRWAGFSRVLSLLSSRPAEYEGVTSPSDVPSTFPGITGVVPRLRRLATPLWRHSRSISGGLAGMCCSQGCTKHDIGRLC
ncbi:hypothetical protein DNTS_026648 [Danionella cerebrum]|uniref:Insulin-like domain-containing protein n=1 Tax=Danionella cerebrum TaxID=2873325 RepID=A0A553Q2S3_9TELE|nr:hypothetical protein DNTS_026648 [Danionella translucida]